ncbi:MAG TPA: sigma-70 family RNA polymerase sigma factor [Polyangia bacterium]|nr:sigma-70 family RNA polymerase sigma factor [Polyangia bacterium]
MRLTCLAAFNQELNYIFRSLYRLGIPAKDVEDLAQDIFLAMRSAWAAYDPRRPVKPYIYGITYNVAMLYRRKHHREVSGEVPDLPDGAPGADDAFDSHHIRNIALAALQTIPLPRRAVLVMHEIDGVPVADVARELSLSVFTVYSRLRKARVELEVAVRRLTRQVDGGWTRQRRCAATAR